MSGRNRKVSGQILEGFHGGILRMAVQNEKKSRESSNSEAMRKLGNPLVIGDIKVEKPIIQGGMGVGISLSSLAGAVAKEGGMGIISTAQIGFKDPDFKSHQLEANLRAIGTELKKAREIAPEGVIGFNIMVATKQYSLYVKEAVKAGADVIISGAGLPVDLPRYVAEGSRTGNETGEETGGNGKGKRKRVKLAPIVSSVKSVSVICKMWDRKYHMAPDFVVVEGPLAGGHLGFSREQLAELGADTKDVEATFKKDCYEEEIHGIIEFVNQLGEKYEREIPVITAGGVYSHEDVLHQLELGASGVQAATRFVTTEECDGADAYKQAYIRAKKEDIVITKSPVGMPGRAIRNPFLEKIQRERIAPARCFQCLEHCNPRETPYCITDALIRAAVGDVDNGLLFCGSNAYRAERIETVAEVMRDLMGELLY